MHEGGQPVQSPRRPRRAGERLCSIAAQGGHAKCRAARRRRAGGANGPWSSMLARSIGAAVKCPMRRVDGKAARLLRISPSACRSAPPAPAPPASSTCGRRPRVAFALSIRSRAALGREIDPAPVERDFLPIAGRSPRTRSRGLEPTERAEAASSPTCRGPGRSCRAAASASAPPRRPSRRDDHGEKIRQPPGTIRGASRPGGRAKQPGAARAIGRGRADHAPGQSGLIAAAERQSLTVAGGWSRWPRTPTVLWWTKRRTPRPSASSFRLRCA